jgi:hypothetical protein
MKKRTLQKLGVGSLAVLVCHPAVVLAERDFQGSAESSPEERASAGASTGKEAQGFDSEAPARKVTDRTVLPIPDPDRPHVTTLDVRDAKPPPMSR